MIPIDKTLFYSCVMKDTTILSMFISEKKMNGASCLSFILIGMKIPENIE